MGACKSSSTKSVSINLTYSAFLIEIYELVPVEEQRIQFSKKSEILKYYDEFDWNNIYGQFKQNVKTLIDHIESCKIRLVDTALYIENKIKINRNPIILKMSLLIMIELVQNMPKFIQQKEVHVQQEESKIEMSVKSEHLQTLTYISDNFLKFELTFSAILSHLTNSLQIYNRIWFDYMIEALDAFAQKSLKQFQSENILSILVFLEYIIGVKYGLKLQSFFIYLFIFIFKIIYREPLNQDDSQHIQELVERVQEVSRIQQTYNQTLQMVYQERLFLTKNQKQLFITFSKMNNRNKQSTQMIEIIILKALNLKLYEELFESLYESNDDDHWSNLNQVKAITQLFLNVSKTCNQQLTIEIFLLTKFFDALGYNNQSQIDSPPPLSKKLSNSSHYVSGIMNNKGQLLKLISYLLEISESSQYVLFSLNQVMKQLLNNLRSSQEQEIYEDTNKCLSQIQQIVMTDQNSYQQYIQLLIQYSYQHSQQLSNGTSQNQYLLLRLLELIYSSLQKSQQSEYKVQLKDDQIYSIIDINDSWPFTMNICAKILVSAYQQQSLDSNESFYIHSLDILSITAYTLTNILLMIDDQGYMDEIFYQYTNFMDFLKENQIQGLMSYLIDERQKSLMKSSSRKKSFDELDKRNLKFCLVFTLSQYIKDESIRKQLDMIFYSLLGPNFILFKKKGISAYQEIQKTVENISLNDISFQIYKAITSQIDFEGIKSKFKESLQKMNQGIVQIDDIYFQEDRERNSLYQSFQAGSFVDVKLDESFEKVLQTVKKQKAKQDKLDQIQQ